MTMPESPGGGPDNDASPVVEVEFPDTWAGCPVHTGQVCAFGVAPNVLEHAQKSFERVSSWQCVSSPTTVFHWGAWVLSVVIAPPALLDPVRRDDDPSGSDRCEPRAARPCASKVVTKMTSVGASNSAKKSTASPVHARDSAGMKSRIAVAEEDWSEMQTETTK